MKFWIPDIARMAWCRASRPLRARARRLNGGELQDPGRCGSPIPLPPGPDHRTPGPCPVQAGLPPDSSPPPLVVGDLLSAGNPDAYDLKRYLLERQNPPDDIRQLHRLLQMPRVLLEIGCGSAEAARLIALKNPDMGVIASDRYDWGHDSGDTSYYGKIARRWRARRLPAQQDSPANLVILRAEAELLRHLPLQAIDTILLINPEPSVGKAFIELLGQDALCQRIKQGPTRLVILPYSRELGVMACGGCSFEHDPDWSRGLGYLMGSGLPFKRGLPVQWGVDLSRISAYSGNSTQRDLYIHGDPTDTD